MVHIIAHIVQCLNIENKNLHTDNSNHSYALQCLALVTFRTPELKGCVPSQISHVYVLETGNQQHACTAKPIYDKL